MTEPTALHGIKVTYIYDFACYQALQKARNKTWKRYKFGSWLMPVLGLIYCGWGAYELLFMQNQSAVSTLLSQMMLALGILLLALHFIFRPWKRRQSFRVQNVDGREISFEFMPEKIRTANKNGNGEAKWSVFEKVTEMPDHFIFWHNKLLGESVPKYAFENGEQLQAFREILKQNFKEKDYIQ